MIDVPVARDVDVHRQIPVGDGRLLKRIAGLGAGIVRKDVEADVVRSPPLSAILLRWPA